MSTCKYCGSDTAPHGFEICAWCLKEIDDNQKKIEENRQPSYFNGDRDDYKGEIDYG